MTTHQYLQRILALFLLLCLLPVHPPGRADAAWTVGNSDLNIQNGGIMLSYGEVFYYADQGIYRQTKEEITQISQDIGKNLNFSAGYVYYTVDHSVYRVPEQGGVAELLYTHPNTIDQMYVILDTYISFLSLGCVWTYPITGGRADLCSPVRGIQRFIPTQYGTILFTGDLFSYTLYVHDTPVLTAVSSAYVDGDLLILHRQGKDQQIPLETLFLVENPQQFLTGFMGKKDENPQAFLHANVDAPTICSVCEAIAETGDATARMLSLEDADLAPLAHTMALTQGQQNIVKRARQQHEIKWTPQIDRYQWGGNGVFQAGVTYRGIPYGQPVQTGYVPWNISFSGFVRAVNDPTSVFYNGYSTYNKIAPYYSSDCSGFVSYAWGTASRMTTYTLPSVAQLVSDQSIYSLQVGDILNHSTSHVVLVTAVGYDASGVLSTVDIMEQTPMITRQTRYGNGGTKPLSVLQSVYLNNGYVIYRNPRRDSVTYTHDCAVPLDGDTCSLCQPSTQPPRETGLAFTDVPASKWYAQAVGYVYAQGIFSGTTATTFSPEQTITRGMFVTALGRMAGLGSGLKSGIAVVTGSHVNLRQSPEGTVLGVCEKGQVVQVLSTQGQWYQVQYGKLIGYIRSDLLKLYDGRFTDLISTAYHTPYIEWAALTGIANGTTKRTFSPNQSMTREEMCVLLYNYCKTYGILLPETGVKVQGFADQDKISAWAKLPVQTMQQAGIVSGVNGSAFEPKRHASRAEAALVLQNLHVLSTPLG